MPLEIISGRAGSGKSQFIIEKIKKIADNGGRAILIVPEQYSHEAESSLSDRVGFVSERILATSFKRLSFSVLKKCAKAKIYADARVKNMLMANTLYALSNKLSIFASASRNPGFITSILDVISEFKRAVVTPEEVKKCAEKIDDNDYFAQKMAELGMIYETYTKAFNKNLADSQDSITLACEQIKNSGMFCDAHIFIDEFFRFTRQEMLFIKALLCEKCDVTVSLCMDEKNPGGVFDPVLNTFFALKKTCADAQEHMNIRYLGEAKRFKTEELAHLERELTNYPHARYEEIPQNVSILAAPDIYSEIMAVASKINTLVKKEGYRYSEIGVIAGNYDRYASVLGTVFDYYDIPVFVDDKRSMLSHPLMLMIFSVFDILSNGFNTEDVLTYVKTGFSKISELEADILENHVIKSGIKNSDWLDDARFILRAKSVFSNESEISDVEQAELLNIKNKVIVPICNLKRKFSENKKFSHRINALFEFFDETFLLEKLTFLRDRLEKSGDKRSASELGSVYEILCETLNQASVYMEDSAAGVERLKTVLLSGFADLAIGVVPTECDKVLLGDENRSVMKNVKSLFIIGANSGAFPQEVQSGGIFSDNERIFLEKQGMQLAPTTEKRVLDSRFGVYSALTIPKEKLYISYAIADFEGKGLRPSQMVSQIKRIFKNIKTEGSELMEEGFSTELISSYKSAYNFYLHQLEKGNDDLLTSEIKKELFCDEEIKKRIIRTEERIKYDKKAEKLAPECVKALYGESLTGSVSRFELFSQCPFAYFVQYGLKAEERKSPAPEATDTGSLLHSVIELFSKKVYEEGRSFRDISKSECEELICKTVDEIVNDSFISKLYSKNKLISFVKRLKSLAVRSALAICEHVKRGEFEPCAFEFSFSENGDTEPIYITLPNGRELSVIGKIDRVDALEKNDKVYIKIIDYKSGNKSFSLSDVYNKLSLQLTVYLTAILKNGENKKAAGMFYFRLSDPVTEQSSKAKSEDISEEIIKKYKMSGLVLSEAEIFDLIESGKESGHFATIPLYKKKDGGVSEKLSSCASGKEFEVLQNYVKNALSDIGNEIFSGVTDISPVKNGKQTACDYCKFGSVCGAGKYVEAPFRNALSIDKTEAFAEMEKNLESKF